MFLVLPKRKFELQSSLPAAATLYLDYERNSTGGAETWSVDFAHLAELPLS
jgi:hypothetical protein